MCVSGKAVPSFLSFASSHTFLLHLPPSLSPLPPLVSSSPRPRPLAFNLSPPSPPLSHFSCGQRTSSAKVGCSSVLSPPSPQQDPSRPHYKNGHMYGSKEMDTDLWIQMNRYRVGMLDIALYLLTILQHAHTAHIYHTHKHSQHTHRNNALQHTYNNTHQHTTHTCPPQDAASSI